MFHSITEQQEVWRQMFIVGEAVVEDAITRAEFCCALKICKGACCTMEGGRGAPLELSEIPEIERAFPVIRRYLTPAGLETIRNSGLIDGSLHDPATQCVEGRECVFVTYDAEKIARCSFEIAYLAGEISWRKPISCHLFPIRIGHTDREVLRYEQIRECEDARRNGAERGIALKHFLKESLIRKYGEAWYDEFLKRCDAIAE